MSKIFIDEVEELMRETFEGGSPGKGTQYLDHDSGIMNTLRSQTVEQVSHEQGRHPSIVSHVHHMIFHLKVASEWIEGDHSKRDWKGSFLPQAVNEEEWSKLLKTFEVAKEKYLNVIRALPEDKVISESGAMGVIAHLAYHLGAIRQHLS